MKRITVITFMAVAVFLAVGYLNAATVEDIEFPVAELSDCTDKQDCKKYCDLEENRLECIDFAEEYGIMGAEEAERARTFANLGVTKGPGGCASDKDCKAYCEESGHMGECLSFARKHRLMTEKELKEAEKVEKALAKGAELPGGCRNKQACDAYCKNEKHLEECMAFAEAAGFIAPEEATMIRKTGGKGPGDCRGKKECDAYCEDPENMEVCMEFALNHDIMPAEEAEEARKMLKLMKRGIKPPKCERGKCEKYCREPEHAQECVEFALAAGHMTQEEADRVLKMAELGITGGPGGCDSEKQCKNFCNNPENSQTCLDFALQMGDISQEEYDQIMENGGRMGEAGPGGCMSREECKAYCDQEANQEECTEHAYESGNMSEDEYNRIREGFRRREEGGPGGCRTEAECRAYCEKEENRDECRRHAPPGMGPGPDTTAPSPEEIKDAVMNEAGIDELPPPPSIEEGGPPPGSIDCSRFNAAPSCDMVPPEVREACRNCRK